MEETLRSVIVDSWMKGLRDFDVAPRPTRRAQVGHDARCAEPQRDPTSTYIEGYIRWVLRQGPCGRHLRLARAGYYMADAALSLPDRRSLGQGDDARLFRARSLGYKRYYSPESGTLRPLHPDGTFLSLRPEAGENFTALGLPRGSANCRSATWRACEN